jgi:hypothetical protein
MSAGVGVKGGYPHEPVNARLGLEVSVGELAADGKGHTLDPCLLAPLVIGDLRAPPLPLTVAEIHAQQHLGPVLGFGAAGPGVDGDETGTPVMGAGKHLLEFGVGYRLLQLFVEPVHLFQRRGILRFSPKLDQHPDIFLIAAEPIPVLHDLPQGGPLLEEPLGILGVIPESGSGNGRLQLKDILPLVVYVKVTPVAC